MSILNPDIGGGNNTPPAYDFRGSLPEDIRQDPVFDALKPKDSNEALALLGKGYVHAQRTIGQARLPAPQKDWKPEQWASFNKALGVPETPDKYETPNIKFPEGLELVPEKLQAYKKIFHDLGLRPDQAAKLQEFYFNDIAQQFGGLETSKVQAREQGVAKLKEKYGDQVDQKLDIGRSVLKKFGSEAFMKTITDAGLDNNPDFIGVLVGIGESIMDDTATGQGDGLPVGERVLATQEIAKLKTDTQFQEALNNRSNPGHAAAVDKWLNLHRASAGPDKK